MSLVVARPLVVIAATAFGVIGSAAVLPDAAWAAADDGANAVFTQHLRARYPNTRIDSVAKSILPGLYEVVMGSNIAYVDETGRYFLFGHVWDMATQKDLTADRRADLDRVDLTVLPKELAVRTVAGNGRREVFVLADPSCHYCRELEKTLAAMPDLTVYTYLLPILGDESKRLAEQIWCSEDRSRAWRDWMTKAMMPSGKTGCDTPLRTIATAASALGITATPMVLAPDGRRHAGAMTGEELAAFLTRGPAVSQGGAVTTQTAEP